MPFALFSFLSGVAAMFAAVAAFPLSSWGSLGLVLVGLALVVSGLRYRYLASVDLALNTE